MFGKTDLVSILILLVSSIALATDLARGRIYNWLTLPAMAIGLALAAFGLTIGFASSLMGIGAGFVLFAWMFLIGVMGGGDVKLLMALGALGGARFAVETALLSILVGGAVALIFLVARGRFRSFLDRLKVSVVTFVAKDLAPTAPMIDRKQKMPFGIAIAIASFWAVFGNPFESLGIRLWH